ncbi:hypothetical protein MNBD_BACTEROID04-1665 [hydrothermal vent metagenome]|uniref:Lipoprotein n=1 Tax=hydrothermal vent metagenome TaxID=652676 RepID=A0A3B0U691_9ZZZZ
MRALIYFLAVGLFIIGCSSTTKTITTNNTKLPEEAVIIANDSLEYEITIIDLGFKLYLNTIAKPANYYSQKYYETKNQFYVTRWNIRAQNPLRYDDSIYENTIDYDFNTDYGLDVNYKLYNYFKFVEYKYHQVF